MSAFLTVAVLGASANPDRYSNMAMRRLRKAGQRVIPGNPCTQDHQKPRSRQITH